MQIIDTFSGIGGFSYAGAMMGWRTVQFCEMNEFCNKILSYYWPGVPIHIDIKTLTAEQIINNGLYDKNETTILTGGVPCQPWSLAGKRKGEEDDRNLWPQTIKLIGSLQPDFAVLENVPGFINWNKGIFLEQMFTSLEAEGYEVFPVVLPACGVNAPHRRDRIWFVAHSTSLSCGNGTRNDKHGTQTIQEKRPYELITSPNTDSNGHELWRLGENRSTQNKGVIEQEQRERIWTNNRGASKQGVITNSDSRRQPRKEHGQKESGFITEKSIPNNWKNFPTESPICGGNDGVPSQLDGITFPKWRNESIKAYGNAIVPQVAYEIFKVIDFINKNNQDEE
jgi:DNA (cytosine-5)-methyltransferase 1